jgi:hypothetical protein
VQSSVQLPELCIADEADPYDESSDALGPARAILLGMLSGSVLWALILWLIFR